MEARSPAELERNTRALVKDAKFYDIPEVIFDCESCDDFNKLRRGPADTVILDRFLSYEGVAVNKVKFVLGIISATRHCSLRNLHRSTWMQYTHICDPKDFADPRCEIFPVFVVAGVAEHEVENSGDVVRLMAVTPAAKESTSKGYTFGGHSEQGGEEEMWLESNLKTAPWFEHAVKQFPWASHVGKMDLDTLPDIAAIHAILARAPQQGIYYGRRIADDGQGGFKGVGCMYGEFYLVTADVVPCWLTEGHKLAKKEFRVIAEDQVFGYGLVKAVNRGKCMVTEMSIRSRAWWHQR